MQITLGKTSNNASFFGWEHFSRSIFIFNYITIKINNHKKDNDKKDND